MRSPAIGLSLLACGCATMSGNDSYFLASDDDPPWLLQIGGGMIRLAVGRGERHQVSPLEEFLFPLVAPTVSGNRSVWTASASGKTIVIESEFVPSSPCSRRSGDTVRVVVDGREFRGCGGRQILVRPH